MKLPAPSTKRRRDLCPKCQAEMVAIAPSEPLVWPYSGIELACVDCESKKGVKFEIVSVAQQFYRRIPCSK